MFSSRGLCWPGRLAWWLVEFGELFLGVFRASSAFVFVEFGELFLGVFRAVVFMEFGELFLGVFRATTIGFAKYMHKNLC